MGNFLLGHALYYHVTSSGRDKEGHRLSNRRITRRQFLASAAGAASAGLLASATRSSWAEEPPEATVVRVRRPDVFAGGDIPQDVVTDMVHAAVGTLAGRDDPAAAWATFVKPDDVVGIKINCLFGSGASTHPEVVNAIIAGCRAAGVPDDHIIVWDRTSADLAKAGYPINRDGPGVKFYGTDGDYEEQPTHIGVFRGRVSNILTRTITALINVPILKTHSLSGITMSLKNHYGSFHNPGDFHDGNCDPAMSDINSIPAIREKTQLIVADALFPIAEGGPQARPAFTWPYGAVLAATDTVAVDYVGLQILEGRRRELGLPPIGRAARHIATAAARGLGTNDPSRIRLLDLA